jgi:hypothetical protein
MDRESREVIIDGVRYVPVCDAHPLAKQIAVGIVAQYWGELDPNDPKTPGKIEGLTIDVREDGQGVSVENAVSDILEAISRWPAR